MNMEIPKKAMLPEKHKETSVEKRIPKENFVSLEEILHEKDGENLDSKLDQYFLRSIDTREEEEKDAIIEQALSQLEKNAPGGKRLADIIRRRYLSVKQETQEQIGDSYGIDRKRVGQLEEKGIKKLRDIVRKMKQ